MRALVIRRTPYGEGDWVVQFFLENGKRQSGFAAGGRNSKRRFPHQFDPCGIYECEWNDRERAGNQIVRLKRCDLLEYSAELKKNVGALARWALILEWIAVDEMEAFEFEEILQMRFALDQSPLTIVNFLFHQIDRHGLRPELEACLRCETPFGLKDSDLSFSFDEGGLLHKRCTLYGEPISNEIYQSLKTRIPSDKMAPALEHLLLSYLEHQLGFSKSLKAHRFLKEVTSFHR